MQSAIVGARLFDGESFHQGAALVLDGDRIAALVREANGQQIPSKQADLTRLTRAVPAGRWTTS